MNRREFGQEEFTNEQFVAGGVTLLLSGFVGFVGNILVLIITYRILKYRKNIPSILILFLAWTDLLTFPFIYPQSLIKYFYGSYVGNYIACDYQATVITFLFTVSICLVLVMSIDRLLALHKPFCYEKYITYDKEKVKVAGIGLGSAGLTIALLPAFGVGRNVLHFPGTFCLFEWGAETIDGKALVYIYIGFLSCAILGVVICNLAVVVLTWRLLRKIKNRNTTGDKEATVTQRETSKTPKEATKEHRKQSMKGQNKEPSKVRGLEAHRENKDRNEQEEIIKQSQEPGNVTCTENVNEGAENESKVRKTSHSKEKSKNKDGLKVHRVSSQSGQMERNFAKLSCLAAVGFVGCWSLFLIRITMIQAGFSFDAFTDFTAIRLASLHSVVNPWLYPLIRRKYREGFLHILTWVGHVITCTLINKPTTTLDDIVGGTPKIKRSKKVQLADRRRSSSRFLSTSTLTTESKVSHEHAK